MFETSHDFEYFYVNENFIHCFIVQYNVNFILIFFILLLHWEFKIIKHVKLNIVNIRIAYSIVFKLFTFNKWFKKNYNIWLMQQKVKKFKSLILSMFFNIVKHLCKEMLNCINIIKMYNQKIFFEYILINEIYREINMIITRLKICKKFSRINKFFIINTFFKYSFKIMWCWIKCLSHINWRKVYKNIRN